MMEKHSPLATSLAAGTNVSCSKSQANISLFFVHLGRRGNANQRDDTSYLFLLKERERLTKISLIYYPL